MNQQNKRENKEVTKLEVVESFNIMAQIKDGERLGIALEPQKDRAEKDSFSK